MKIIVRGRALGKTTEAIKIAHEKRAYIVCLHYRDAQRIADQARRMGLKIPFPITFNEFLEGRFEPRGVQRFVIDNADMLLQHAARGAAVEAVTLDGEPHVSDLETEEWIAEQKKRWDIDQVNRGVFDREDLK